MIAQLKLFLDRHRDRSGNPAGGFIFRNPLGNSLNLDALVTEVIRPAIEAEKIPWYGWHAFRRGLATNLHRLGVSGKVIQQILRHAGCGRSDEKVGVELFPSCSPNCSPIDVRVGEIGSKNGGWERA